MTAEFGPCGTYRYVLTRELTKDLSVKTALFVMLNPSTADAVNDGPTIRRRIGFAKREGCTRLTVVNLFALRATDPKELLRHPDPVGPLNKIRIVEQVTKVKSENGIIVAAWGAHKLAENQSYSIRTTLGPLLCLGKTKTGAPKHPLYLKNVSPLVRL